MTNVHEKPKRITRTKKNVAKKHVAILAVAWTGVTGIHGLAAAKAHFRAEDARAKEEQQEATGNLQEAETYGDLADKNEDKRKTYLKTTGLAGVVALINASAAHLAPRTEEGHPDVSHETLPQAAAPPPPPPPRAR